jgi:hypothetical protein
MITRKSNNEYQVVIPPAKKLKKKILDYNALVLHHDTLREMIDWCTETFGQGGRNLRWRYGGGNANKYGDIFVFKNERDAMWFRLRWA